MREFFRGWRRKIGVVTLMMACIFMGGWCRSTMFHDICCVRANRTSFVELHSLRHSFVCQLNYDSSDGPDLAEVRSFTMAESDFDPFQYYGEFFSDHCWQQHGFGICRLPLGIIPKGSFDAISIPYWSITIPMTLISFSLLLSKPRKSTQKKITEPVTVEGK